MEEKITDTRQLVFWDSFGFYSRHSGIYRYATSLADCLETQGFHPRFLVSENSRSLSHTTEPLSLSPRRQRIKSLWASWAYGELCERYRGPLLFHGLSNLNLPLKKKNPQHVFFLTLHDGIPLVAPRGVSVSVALQSRLLLPFVVSLADRIICVSRWTMDWVESAYPKARGKCVHIPNGFSPWRASSIFSLPGAKLRVLVVSRFEKYKQFDLLVKILQKTGDLFSVTVVSDFRGAAFLRERLGKNQQGITLLSAIEEGTLQRLYGASDVLLHTSRFEGFCLPAAEALACGVPVVFCRGSGIDEVVGASVGSGLEATAPVSQWVDALEGWGQKRRTSEFQQSCCLYVGGQVQWSQAADLLLKEYRLFAFS